MPASAIAVRGLRKSYGDVEAVRGVDLTVDEGEVFALLGPNGAGKTTTVEILEGFRARDAGDVVVLGSDPGRRDPELKRRIGVVLQETSVDPYLTVAEAIEMYRGYYPAPRALDEVLGVVGLADQRDAKVRKLSGGQQRRLDVALGLAGDPELLFLDEPTTGFDPAARRGAWEMIRNLRALGKTVLLTTHYMDEAQHLADRVAIIVQGRIVAEGRPEILIGADRGSTIRFRLPGGVAPPRDVEARTEGDDHVVETDRPTAVLHALTTWAVERGIELEALTVSRASLEDVYLELTADTAEGAP